MIESIETNNLELKEKYNNFAIRKTILLGNRI